MHGYMNIKIIVIIQVVLKVSTEVILLCFGRGFCPLQYVFYMHADEGAFFQTGCQTVVFRVFSSSLSCRTHFRRRRREYFGLVSTRSAPADGLSVVLHLQALVNRALEQLTNWR